VCVCVCVCMCVCVCVCVPRMVAVMVVLDLHLSSSTTAGTPVPPPQPPKSVVIVVHTTQASPRRGGAARAVSAAAPSTLIVSGGDASGGVALESFKLAADQVRPSLIMQTQILITLAHLNLDRAVCHVTSDTRSRKGSAPACGPHRRCCARSVRVCVLGLCGSQVLCEPATYRCC